MTRDDDIFGEARALPAGSRAAYLDRTCGADSNARSRVEALLKGYDRAGDFLLRPAVARIPQQPDEQPGDVIGRYTLVKKIGEGGWGSVYLAEQKVPVRRRVALKIIKLGMDTRQVIARFEGERQALALMDHPDIARVLDAGSTEAGRPFFVMEYVDGVPINKYCDAHRMPIAERLALFARVCLALQHAHQKGIIHRDVKPSNILISNLDGAPAPKVIDFGIAKATQDRLTEHTLVTSVGQFIGTPAYMSPEQADQRDLDIDTRSDVYALGVLLYELLCGRLPFDVKLFQGAGVDAVRRIIRETEPPLLPARFVALPEEERNEIAGERDTTSAALAAMLRDDLDWIAARCLEKDRAERYGSAQELADDIRRHLNQEPVIARPPSALYRSRRFVARHRVACASAAAIAISLIVGTVISVRQAVRATRAEHAANTERDNANTARDAATAASHAESLARADAQRRQDQAEDMLGFMLGNFRTELKNVNVDALAAVDKKATDYFAALDPRDLTDTVLTIQAKTLYQIGETNMEKARYNDAAAAFAASYQRSAALVTRHPENADMLFERAQAEYWNGFVALRRGDFQAESEWSTRYRDSALGLVKIDANHARAQLEVAYSQHNLAAMELTRGNLGEALKGFQSERAAVELLLAAKPNDAQLQYRLADNDSWLGSVAERDGRLTEAAKHFLGSATRYEALITLEPKATRWRLRLADSLALAADVQLMLRQRPEASANYDRARALREALVTQDPKNRQWQQALLNGRLKQVALSLADGDFGTAAPILVEVRDKVATLIQAEPSSRIFPATLATAWRLEANLRLATHRPDAAEAAKQACELGETLIKEARADDRAVTEFAQSCLVAGRIASAQSQPELARTYWTRAVEVLEPRLPATSDWRFLDPAIQAAALLGKLPEARQLVERLREIGYHPLDPLAESTLDSVSSTLSPNPNQKK